LALAELLELRLHLADGLALPLKKLSLLLQELLLRLVVLILLLEWAHKRIVIRQIGVAIALAKEL
jgi:hypothetical protein